MGKEKFILSLFALYALFACVLILCNESWAVVLGCIGFIFVCLFGLTLSVITIIDVIIKSIEKRKEYNVLLKLGKEIIPDDTETPFIVNGYVFVVSGCLGGSNYDSRYIAKHTKLKNKEKAILADYLVERWQDMYKRQEYIYDSEISLMRNLCWSFFNENRRRLFKRYNIFNHYMINSIRENTFSAFKLTMIPYRHLCLYGIFPNSKIYKY